MLANRVGFSYAAKLPGRNSLWFTDLFLVFGSSTWLDVYFLSNQRQVSPKTRLSVHGQLDHDWAAPLLFCRTAKNGSGFRCRSQPFAGCELAPSVLGLHPPQSGMNLLTSFLKAGDLGWSWLLVRFGHCLHQNGIKYPVVADCGKGTLLLHPFVATNSIHSFLDLS